MVAHRIDARRPGADEPLGPGVERVHLVGIGGAGMEGLARLLDAMGYRVTGSDVSEGPVIEDLRRSGIAVFHGHDAAHTRAADLLIHSAAILESNPERRAASSAGIRQLRRASALGLLSRGHDTVAVAGTHGKTTTTSLVATVVPTTTSPVATLWEPGGDDLGDEAEIGTPLGNLETGDGGLG
ncbi:uncharacterized protein METZ01_LOCUS215802, partial [marine metagenome]